ncbi:MAG: chemotaxis protein CheA, partial [Chlamydiales bacterium]
IIHAVENVLDDAKKQKIVLLPELITPLYDALDALTLLSEEAITGKPANVNEENLLIHLRELNLPARPTKEKQHQEEIQKPPAPKAEMTPTSQIKSEKIALVRVEVQKIDELLREASELLVSKNRLLDIRQQLENISNLEELNSLKSVFFEEVHKLENLTDKLIVHIQALNLIPISKLFSYFPRTIRELSTALGKEVEINFIGEELEVDKRIVEGLKDPMMHLLRNAMDHGIETPEARRSLGKPQKGLITVQAQQLENQVILEVSDDGRGIDLEKIKRIALEKNMYSEQELQNLSVEELYRLIFSPGFSTASSVTTMSGRGVGLDVVQRTLETMNGKMSIHSIPNEGTTFRIELPANMLLTSALFINVRKHIYALPMEMVESCGNMSQYETVASEKGVIVLNKGVPLSVISLEELLFHETSKPLSKDQHVVFVKIFNDHFGLLVDEIIGANEVAVQPPSLMLNESRTIIGSTILLTGQVCLVLNPSGFLSQIRRLKSTPSYD